MRSDLIDRNRTDFFDLVFGDGELKNITGLDNLGMLIFNDFPGRENNSEVIISHLSEKLIRIKLDELRKIIAALYGKFRKAQIQKGHTVFLSNFEINSELYTSILFLALSSYGVKVFLPMYIEQSDFDKWFHQLGYNAIIFPERELSQISGNKRQKKILKKLKRFAVENSINFFDSFSDFSLDELVANRKKDLTKSEIELKNKVINDISPEAVGLLMTTSGTTQDSRIVAYTHNAFMLNLSSWENAGLLKKEKLGGRSFTPLLTHTMGIRTLINGLYTGEPIVLINTNWFEERPEAVNFFLKEAKPEHITGGPAVFRLILEMCRVFPDLKNCLRECLRTLVSCGANIEKELITKLKDNFEVNVHNALGTTETQQVITTLIGNSSPEFLGKPFPGVSLGLKATKDAFYKLYIRSEYGASWILEDTLLNCKGGYLYLGDIVDYKDGEILYKYREVKDYLNDEFGVKVPIKKVLNNYVDLTNRIYHLKLIPLKFTPGLAGLVFIEPDKRIEKSFIGEIKQLIENINTSLFSQLDPLDFQHRTIKRFTICESEKVLNAKGAISDAKIIKEKKDMIERLTSDNLSKDGISEIREIKENDTLYFQNHNPYLANMLSALEMDVAYSTAEGDHLFTSGKIKDKILDLTGGYGTNILGHNNNRLVKHAIEFLKSNKIPLSDQFSNQNYPARLATKLNDILSKYTGKNYYTHFGSTGSEVVEMAIHHAYLEWKKNLKNIEQSQKMKFGHLKKSEFGKLWEENYRLISEARVAIIINKKAYHGNTSAARSLMGNIEMRKKFSHLLPIDPIFIDDTLDNIEKEVKRKIEDYSIDLNVYGWKEGKVIQRKLSFPLVIGALLEPILGEGGIKEINPLLPRSLMKYDFPIIFDEIQSGLGRSGSFLASEEFKGDYYLFSKALGGNIEKVASLSIDKARYIEKFGKLYLSTFSGGAFGISLALESLKIIEEENIPLQAKLKGNELKSGLERIKNKYPNIIETITGKGLMIGIKFSKFTNELFFRVLQERKIMGYLISSYLLNKHQIRITPSLSAPDILRVEPSASITKNDINLLFTAIEDVAVLIERKDIYNICKHLMGNDPFTDNKGKYPDYGFIDTNIYPPDKGALKIAFIVHFAYTTEEFRMIFKSLTKASDTGLWKLYEKFATVMDMEPFLLNSKNIYNGRVHLSTIVLPLDSASLEKYHRTSKNNKVIAKIQKAVNYAGDIGAKFISLGGYTSIITNNGLKILEPENSRVVTGNTLTAVVGYNKFKNAITELKSGQELKIGVVGAHGNIGKILATALINERQLKVSNLILIGKNKERLEKYLSVASPESINPDLDIEISTSLLALTKCDAILVAVNTNDPIIIRKHIAKDKVVIISDLSVPEAVSPDLKKMENIYLVPFGASIRLTEDPDHLITSCSPRGTALCCLAEAILNAFEEVPIQLKGELTYEGFKIVETLARKHNFIQETEELKSYKTV